MSTYPVNYSECLYCHREFDEATAVSGGQPKSGDLTLCRYCAHLMIFDDELRVRYLTPEELEQVREDPRLRELCDKTAEAIRLAHQVAQ